MPGYIAIGVIGGDVKKVTTARLANAATRPVWKRYRLSTSGSLLRR